MFFLGCKVFRAGFRVSVFRSFWFCGFVFGCSRLLGFRGFRVWRFLGFRVSEFGVFRFGSRASGFFFCGVFVCQGLGFSGFRVLG